MSDRFESNAIAIKEWRTELAEREAALCHDAVFNGRESELAGLWGWATTKVKNWALVWEHFQDDIYPDEPLALYLAAIEHDNPKAALRLARREGWSATDLRNYLDKRQGVTVSKAYTIKERVQGHYGDSVLTLYLPLPDRRPEMWEVTAREVVVKEAK